MTDIINPNAPAVPGTAETPTLIPDSPEYRAAMIAKAEAQTNPDGGTPATDPAKSDPALAQPIDPNAPTPKLTDTSNGEQKTDEAENKDGEGDKPSAYDFAKAFEDGSLVSEFNSEKPSDALIEGMAKALGISNEQVLQMQAQFRAGQEALAREAEAKLFEAAGGRDEFNAIIAWGQKNLSQEQKVFYENLLNGPDAAAAVGILKQKMQAAADPSLVNVSGRAAAAPVGFRDQSEMMAAMSDPRYQTSEAYRRDVAEKLRYSNF
ncbi:hypothetical protein KTE71_13330 [Burkholderia multivorans]|uniref:capsid assembly protein n=1 Tax=Burkholderia multivorans TaxID=87883 RepID=UPI001B9C839E|nr:hypothetical protein [Burkholderia multivorans]MBR8020769.1 hypothetical protein [Burkholderia multivorans]MBU9227304.1 hypothetical protein [Burkholderia multivorans]MBU9388499.1 hypothetical protein [Burkholderia multivorans]MDN8032911.1 hypothetical protein [Burkholderia multivorans]HEF4732938.1 hypothetical protein [Burkholderia multivorans]